MLQCCYFVPLRYVMSVFNKDPMDIEPDLLIIGRNEPLC
jgi:hypothetical protein